jgi:hypothetical protein
MLDVLSKFQNAAAAFNPTVLVAGGVVCVLLGIILWLAGTKFTKMIAAAAGFIGGAVGASYLFPEHQMPAVITGAVAGGLTALVLHRFITIIAGSAFFAVAVFGLLVGTNFSDKATTASYKQDSSAVSIKLTPDQTLEQMKIRLINVGEQLFELSKRLPFGTWPAFAAALVVLAVIGMFFGRLITAFACSSIGAALTFAGMISLLLFKGSAPLTHVYERISFFFSVFAGMVAVGIVSQLILCRPPKLAMVKREQEEEKENRIKKNNPGEHKWTYPQS